MMEIVMEIVKISEDLWKMNVKNKNMTWKHEHDITLDYDAAMLKKEHLKKRLAAWGEADCMPIN